jgi:hypothetical protein
VTAAHLAAAGGLVRCGACQAVFRASERLRERGAAAPPPDPDELQARRHRSVLEPDREPPPAHGTAPGAVPEPEAPPQLEREVPAAERAADDADEGREPALDDEEALEAELDALLDEASRVPDLSTPEPSTTRSGPDEAAGRPPGPGGVLGLLEPRPEPLTERLPPEPEDAVPAPEPEPQDAQASPPEDGWAGDALAEPGPVEESSVAFAPGGAPEPAEAEDRPLAVEDAAVEEEAGAASFSPAPSLDALEEAPTEPAPERESRRRPRGRLAWAAVAVLALGGLAAQLWVRELPRLALDARYRPALETFCARVGCTLPVLRDASRIRSQRLVVRSHPERADALRVDAVIVNRAPWPQPWPELELRFSDLRGELVAARRFAPGEYLDAALAAERPEMPPRRPVQIALELVDPGADAVNYVMTFR